MSSPILPSIAMRGRVRAEATVRLSMVGLAPTRRAPGEGGRLIGQERSRLLTFAFLLALLLGAAVATFLLAATAALLVARHFKILPVHAFVPLAEQR